MYPDRPLVSVIIPAYNSARTIVQALDSVAAQSFADCEVIVVDDASTDNTAVVVRRYGYAERLPSEAPGRSTGGTLNSEKERRNDAPPSSLPSGTPILRNSHTPILLSLSSNSGPAAARNRGIAEAKGEWIAFLDADDAWLPGKLELQLKRASELPAVAMFCGQTVPFEESERILRPRAELAEKGGGEKRKETGVAAAYAERPTEHEESQALLAIPHARRSTSASRTSEACTEVSVCRDLSETPSAISASSARVSFIRLRDFVVSNPVATSTVLVKKSAILAVGGFDERFRGPEDYDLWMRIAARHDIVKIAVPLTFYREQSGSLSMDDRKFLPQVFGVLDKAFGPGGALEPLSRLRAVSESNQYWNASWMAFNRGARARAIHLWIKACLLNLTAERKTTRKWFSLLWRYAVGRVDHRH